MFEGVPGSRESWTRITVSPENEEGMILVFPKVPMLGADGWQCGTWKRGGWQEALRSVGKLCGKGECSLHGTLSSWVVEA